MPSCATCPQPFPSTCLLLYSIVLIDFQGSRHPAELLFPVFLRALMRSAAPSPIRGLTMERDAITHKGAAPRDLVCSKVLEATARRVLETCLAFEMCLAFEPATKRARRRGWRVLLPSSHLVRSFIINSTLDLHESHFDLATRTSFPCALITGSVDDTSRAAAGRFLRT